MKKMLSMLVLFAFVVGFGSAFASTSKAHKASLKTTKVAAATKMTKKTTKKAVAKKATKKATKKVAAKKK